MHSGRPSRTMRFPFAVIFEAAARGFSTRVVGWKECQLSMDPFRPELRVLSPYILQLLPSSRTVNSSDLIRRYRLVFRERVDWADTLARSTVNVDLRRVPLQGLDHHRLVCLCLFLKSFLLADLPIAFCMETSPKHIRHIDVGCFLRLLRNTGSCVRPPTSMTVCSSGLTDCTPLPR